MMPPMGLAGSPHGDAASYNQKVNMAAINNIKKLGDLTPHKFEVWLRAVKRALEMANCSTKRQCATRLCLTLEDSVSDLLDTAPPAIQDDPDEIVRYLRTASIPNMDAEKHKLLIHLLSWRQGSHNHTDYVHSFEKLLTKVQVAGIRLDLRYLSDRRRNDPLTRIIRPRSGPHCVDRGLREGTGPLAPRRST